MRSSFVTINNQRGFYTCEGSSQDRLSSISCETRMSSEVEVVCRRSLTLKKTRWNLKPRFEDYNKLVNISLQQKMEIKVVS